MKNYRLLIEYDGTLFSGWQRQKDQRTVQGEIENTLSIILNRKTPVHGAGRTDAGVHAYGQVATFQSHTKIPCQHIKKGLNAMIKSPVVIHACDIVPDDFHAQYSARSKEYQYVILNRKTPCAIYRSYQWHVPAVLDIDRMNQACRSITGLHDFKSFENTGSPRSHTVREIFHAGFEPASGDRIIFLIHGNGFLKNMVRNLVGTLVDVGTGRLTVPAFVQILEAKDRKKAGPTAPPHGLFLMTVHF